MRKYSSTFATYEHKPIITLKDLGRYDNHLGFFLNGKAIGHGDLNQVSIGKKRKILSTSGTEIFKKYRRKGHGIHLYIALIETARLLGATQIRSDTSLNKLSRRMWEEKLSKIYPVKMARTKIPCRRCGHTPGWKYFYINLTRRKLNGMR
jgi:hypothetical protein